MGLSEESIASRLWAIRGERGRRRRFCVNALIHSVEAIARELSKRSATELCTELDDDGDLDPDSDEPTQAELNALEAHLSLEDEVEEFSESDDISQVLEGKLTFEGCLIVAKAVVALHQRLVDAKLSTEALLLVVENVDDPEVGETFDLDQLGEDVPRV